MLFWEESINLFQNIVLPSIYSKSSIRYQELTRLPFYDNKDFKKISKEICPLLLLSTLKGEYS